MRAQCGLILAVMFALLPGGAPQIPDALLFNRVAISAASSSSSGTPLCNDGTSASFFYRNCSANWDRKPGDPDFCDVPIVRWIIVFMSGGRDGLDAGMGVSGMMTSPSPLPAMPSMPSSSPPPISFPPLGAFCYDQDSCRTRQTNLTTAKNLPSTAFPSGILLPYAEANPNLYKSHSAVVPYCSSDLYFARGTAANATSSSSPVFAGAAIADATIDTLFAIGGGGVNGLAGADEVVVVGPAGIMARMQEISARILEGKRSILNNASATVKIVAMCDGCALLGELSPPSSPPPCTADYDCPPQVALPKAQAFWGGAENLAIPAWCAALEPNETAWRCLTAERLFGVGGPFLPSNASSVSSTTSSPSPPSSPPIPLLFASPQFDATQLAAYGAWPWSGNGTNKTSIRWAELEYAPALRAVAAPFSALSSSAVFLPACAAPSSAALTDSGFYRLLTSCVDSAGRQHNDSLAQAAPALIVDGEGLQCVDECGAWGCNPSGCVGGA